jgi:predicted Rossmann fold flavoprotein
MTKKIAIIGWWAAGMMAMATLVESDFSWEVHLFEKNSSLWAKVIISWGGRCNVTTWYYRRKDIESKYIRGAAWLRETIWNFWPRKIYQWFEDHGVPLKIESDMRVFPVSDNGKDVVGVFERLSQSKKVTLHYKTGIESIRYYDWHFELTTSQWIYLMDAVIIATGGNAYSHTGSTGDAYEWARSLGHTVTALGPSLNSFLSQDKWTHELSGIAFQNAKLEIVIKWKKQQSIWPVLLTHFWLTGPAIFIIAAYSAFETIDWNHPIKILLSVDADKNSVDRHHILLQASKEYPRKQISTILKQYIPDRVVETWNQQVFAGILSQEIWLMSKIIREKIVEKLTGREFIIIGRRPGDEFVTAGWISLNEVDHKSMMSKILPWLFFAWEVLDVDGVTGWYNLTSSWATGKLAGDSITKNL